MTSIRLILTLFASILVGGCILYLTIVDNFLSSWSIKASEPNYINKRPRARSLYTYTEGIEDIASLINNSTIQILKDDFKTEVIAKSSLQNSFNKGSKGLRRRKREIRSQNYVWHFKVNLSRSDVKSTELPHKANETKSLNSQHENPNHLGVAVHVEGNGPEDSYQEMHHAWNSVRDFLKRLFKTNTNELGHKVIADRTGLVSRSKEDQKENSESNSTEESRLSRDREGKFLFGFLGFGGNSENPPMDQGSGEELKQLDSTLEAGNIHNIQSTTIFSAEQSAIPDSTTVVQKERTLLLNKDSKGKFFLGSLGFGGNSENPPMDHGSGEEFDKLNSTFEMENTIDILSTISFSPEQAIIPNSSVTTEQGIITNSTATARMEDSTQLLNKDREAKFFLGFLGFGGNNENPQIDQGSGEELDQLNTTFETGNLHDIPSNTIFTAEQLAISSTLAIMKDATEFPIIENDFANQSAVTSSTEFTAGDSVHTENMTETQFFPTENNIAEVARISTTKRGFGIEDLDLTETAFDRLTDPTTEFITLNKTYKNKQLVHSASKTSDSELVPEISGTNATKAIGTEFEMQTTPSTFLETNESNSIMKENTFATEEVKEFCISLFSRKAVKTPKFSIEFSDNRGKGIIVLEENKMSSANMPLHNKLFIKSKENQSPQSLGFFANVIRASNGPNEELKDDEILSSSEEVTTPDTKIVNALFPNFGSAQAADLDEFNSTEIGNSNKTENINILSVADCEVFFGSIEMNGASSTSDLLINDSLANDKFESEDATPQTGVLPHIEHTTIRQALKENVFNEFGFGSGFSELLEEARTNGSFTEEGLEGLISEDLINEGSEVALFASNATEDSRFLPGFWNLAFGSGERASGTTETSNIDNQMVTSFESTEYSTKEMHTIGESIIGERVKVDTSEKSSHEEKHFASTFHLEDDFFTISTESNKNGFLEFGSGDTKDLPEITGKEQSLICLDCQTKNTTGSSILSGLDPFSQDAINLEETFENDTKPNQPKFIGSLFLPGSGDGAPINLVQETNISSPTVPVLIARRGRVLDDIPDYWQEESLDFSRRRSRFENSFEVSSEPFIHPSTNPKGLLEEFNENIGSEGTRFSIDELDSSISDSDENHVSTEYIPATITDAPTTLGHQTKRRSERICLHDNMCEKSLNERCIPGDAKAICGCGKSFVRHPESGKCETPVLLKTALKLPGEVFHNDLKDETSELFQKKQKEAIDTLYALLGHDPKLLSNIAKVEVTFEEGSVIVNYKIAYVTDGKENVSELVEQVDADIRDALKDEEVLTKVPLNVTQVDLSISSVDPCETSELNYCSKDADCITDEVRGFRCQCKEGFLDNSTNVGEMCIATCTSTYCGDGGFCNLKENGERHCLCSSWFTGTRCEISIAGLITSLVMGIIVLGIVVACIITHCSKRRQLRMNNGEESRRNRGLNAASPASSGTDAIALDIMGPSKYIGVPVPAIKITEPSLPPSIRGSESSYDLDSTFDRTQSPGDANQT